MRPTTTEQPRYDRTNYFETVPDGRSRTRAVHGKRPHGASARRGDAGACSITSAASSRTRSDRATAGRAGSSTMRCSATCSRSATPIITRRSARWPTSTRQASPTSSSGSRQIWPQQRRAGCRRRRDGGAGAAARREVFRVDPAPDRSTVRRWRRADAREGQVHRDEGPRRDDGHPALLDGARVCSTKGSLQSTSAESVLGGLASSRLDKIMVRQEKIAVCGQRQHDRSCSARGFSTSRLM